MNGNADKNGQSTGSDGDDSGEATENTCENLVNASQNNVTLSFENVEEISDEEKIIIKNIIEINQGNLDEKINGFKRVDRNFLKNWTTKTNAFLK